MLNYNGERLLKISLESLRRLHYTSPYINKELIFIDNASRDNSVALVEREFPEFKIIANKKNSGYAGGANQAVQLSRGDFVLIVNPDVVFEPDYLDVLIADLNRDSKIGAIIGKLRVYDFAKNNKTHVIDSAGLLMYRNRRCVDRGQGEEDSGQFDAPEYVFGVTGACPLYRRSTLEDCMVAGEYFDSDFFMYKEDVDLAWRMNLFGWKAFYQPAAIAYHGRGTGAVRRSDLKEVVKNRGGLSKFQRYYSYKNERLMRVKNERFVVLARDFFPIFWKEILMFGWMVLREPFLFKAVAEFFKQLPRAIKKRDEVKKKAKVNTKQISAWFR